jgi:hypothetical protein
VHLPPALTAQSSKCTAGVITAVEVIITDGAEATITVGDIITIDEIKFLKRTAREARVLSGHSIFQIRTEQFISGVLGP